MAAQKLKRLLHLTIWLCGVFLAFSEKTTMIMSTTEMYQHTPSPAEQKLVRSQEILKNQTTRYKQWWDEMITGYDSRLRPYFGVEPIRITIDLRLLSISAITEATMDWTTEIYLYESWHDFRLTFNASHFGSRPILALPYEARYQLWTPDTAFLNALRCIIPKIGSVSHMGLLRLADNGTMYSSRRLSVVASCNMDLTMYPYDQQACRLEMASHGQTVDDILYAWKNIIPINYTEIGLPDFSPLTHYSWTEIRTTGTGDYSVAILCIVFGRRSGFCFLQLLLPATSVVASSWISLWLEDETQFSDILAIILSIIFLSYSYNTVMPKVSYVKAMDMYLGACFIFAFLSLVKLAVVKYMRKTVEKREHRREKAGEAAGLAANSSAPVETTVALKPHGSGKRRRESQPILERNLTSVTLQSFVPAHDRYWRAMKAFHVISQLLLPMFFLIFALFFFFIYPFLHSSYARCRQK